jgi:transcriptional regulator with XRE-family HTH domain
MLAPQTQNFPRECGRPFSTIALLRFLRGWSQRDLAEHAGISKRTIASAETGEHVPMLETKLAIAHALGVEDVTSIFPPNDSGPAPKPTRVPTSGSGVPGNASPA